jgi:hypothetical protein
MGEQFVNVRVEERFLPNLGCNRNETGLIFGGYGQPGNDLQHKRRSDQIIAATLQHDGGRFS